MPIGNQIQYTDNVASKIVSATATASQTTFTIVGGYRVNAIAVYKQGLRLSNGVEFTATDGSTVVLTSGASADDKMVFQIYDDFNVADISAAPGDFTVGGDLGVSGTLSGDGSGLTGVGSTEDVSTSTLNVVGVATIGQDARVSRNLNVAGISTVTLDVRIGRNLNAGIITATTFVGALTGNVTGDASGSSGSCTGNAATATLATNATNASGLTGTPSITVQDITAEMVSIGGTLTYEDVTNIDSVGLVTARTGIQIQAGGLTISGVTTGLSVSGVTTVTEDVRVSRNFNVTGIATVTQGTDLNGYKVEEGSYDSNALNGEFDFEFENGHIQTHTGSTAGTYFPDFRVSGSQSLASVMGTGDVVSATLMVAASNTAHYCTAGVKIDNSTSNVTVEWVGSAAASAGKGAGYDIYAFTIQKTAATPAYLVIINAIDAG